MAEQVNFRVVNLEEAVGDINKYDLTTQKRFKNVLREWAKNVRNQQFTLLKNQVKQWTGHLGGSIGVSGQIEKFYQVIGPDRFYVAKNKKTGEEYSRYIEEGGGSFKGYWYVRDSIRNIEAEFTRPIKRVIEASQRK